jgi:hypothetical protein
MVGAAFNAAVIAKLPHRNDRHDRRWQQRVTETHE